MNQIEYDAQNVFEIVDHGVEDGQYFQGCGTAFTPWNNVVTGVGESAMDAYNDAIMLIDQTEDSEGILEVLPSEPEWLSDEITVPVSIDDDNLGDSEMWHRVSVRW
jgi:hypothetical protein